MAGSRSSSKSPTRKSHRLSRCAELTAICIGVLGVIAGVVFCCVPRSAPTALTTTLMRLLGDESSLIANLRWFLATLQQLLVCTLAISAAGAVFIMGYQTNLRHQLVLYYLERAGNVCLRQVAIARVQLRRMLSNLPCNEQYINNMLSYVNADLPENERNDEICDIVRRHKGDGDAEKLKRLLSLRSEALAAYAFVRTGPIMLYDIQDSCTKISEITNRFLTVDGQYLDGYDALTTIHHQIGDMLLRSKRARRRLRWCFSFLSVSFLSAIFTGAVLPRLPRGGAECVGLTLIVVSTAITGIALTAAFFFRNLRVR